MACSNIGSAFGRPVSIPREWRSRRSPDPGRRLALHCQECSYSTCLQALRQVGTKVDINESAFEKASAFKARIDAKPPASDEIKSNVEAWGLPDDFLKRFLWHVDVFVCSALSAKSRGGALHGIPAGEVHEATCFDEGSAQKLHR